MFLSSRTVIWDKNNISAQGFQDIAVAMEKWVLVVPLETVTQAQPSEPRGVPEPPGVSLSSPGCP